MKTFNIHTPSNAKQRNIAKIWSGDELIVEDSPFHFPIPGCKGHYEIHTAPWVYVNHLPSHVVGILDCLNELVLNLHIL